MKSIILLVGIIFPALFPLCHAFIASSPIGIRMGHVDTTYTSLQPIPKAPTLLPMIPESNSRKSSATAAAAAAASEQQESPARALSVAHSARDALRQITGFSLTAARTALRAATGLSLTAIYAASVAASGLWLRKSTAFLISFVPLSLRVFFQPFLIAYYVPILAVRAYTGPVRKEALARHLATLKAWEEAFRYASQHVDNVFENGYAPMRFDKDGGVEFCLPPNPTDEQVEQFSNGIADMLLTARRSGFQQPSSTTDDKSTGTATTSTTSGQ